MKTFLYSILDKKAKAFGAPFTSVNDQVAMRTVQSNLMQGTSELALHSEDYSLYVVGEFDDVTGQIETDTEPKFLIGIYTLKSTED